MITIFICDDKYWVSKHAVALSGVSSNVDGIVFVRVQFGQCIRVCMVWRCGGVRAHQGSVVLKIRKFDACVENLFPRDTRIEYGIPSEVSMDTANRIFNRRVMKDANRIP